MDFIGQRNKKIPPPVEGSFIESTDGTRLEVWRHPPRRKSELSSYVAVIFHGNGGPVENFIFSQMWFAELGIASYDLDYRGFGRSGGWPSEKGIYRDSDAFWEYVVQRENLEPSQIIVLGISVGSGPAARIAALHQPKLLLLSSAFTDLKSAARAQPVLGVLAPFVWYKFPTIDYVRKLERTDLLLAHGLRDRIVPPNHSELLEDAYSGTGRVRRVFSEEADHNSAFFALTNEMEETIAEWL